MQMNFLTNNPGHSSWGDILNTKLDQSIFTFIDTGTRQEISITRPEHTPVIYSVHKTLSQTFWVKQSPKKRSQKKKIFVKFYDNYSKYYTEVLPKRFHLNGNNTGFHLQILMLRVMHTLYTLTITWSGSERINGYLYD